MGFVVPLYVLDCVGEEEGSAPQGEEGGDKELTTAQKWGGGEVVVVVGVAARACGEEVSRGVERRGASGGGEGG